MAITNGLDGIEWVGMGSNGSNGIQWVGWDPIKSDGMGSNELAGMGRGEDRMGWMGWVGVKTG